MKHKLESRLLGEILPQICRKHHIYGFPGGSVGKESTCSAGDTGDAGSTPGSGRSPEGGHGNPLQYSCLDNPMDRGALQAIAHSRYSRATAQHMADLHCCSVIVVIWSHHFMANRWGDSGNSVRLYLFGLQDHCRW